LAVTGSVRRPTGVSPLHILVAAASAALLPRLALAYFAYPSADDFCIVNDTLEEGFWYMQVHRYLTWTGRYSAVFLESLLVQFDLSGMYRWFAWSTVLSTLLAIRTLIATLASGVVSGHRVTALALVVTAVFVGHLPSTVEAFYWLPGQASYQWGIITYLVWVSLLIRMASGAAGPLQRTLIVVLTVLVPGFNEVLAPMVVVTIASFVVANRWLRFETDLFMLMLLGITIALIAASVMAPGNAYRSSTYPVLASRHNLEYALAETARQTTRFLVKFGSYPALWVGAVAAWWWGARALPYVRGLTRRPRYAAAVLLGLISMVYFTLFPVYWEYGEVNYTGEGRTYNVTYVALCAIVVVAAGLLVVPLIDRFAPLIEKDPATRRSFDLALAGVLAVLLIAAPATGVVFRALQAAPRYLQEEQTRAAILRTSPRQGIVAVDRILVRPPGLFWGDVEPDPTHWINTCVARYYGLEAVRSRM